MSNVPRQVYDSPAPQRRWPSYELICTGFRENLSRLSSLTGYAAIQDAAAALLDLGTVDSAQMVSRSASRLIGGRDRHVFDMLVSAFNAYRRTDLVEARRLATAILETGSEVDPWSSVDAEHIMARTYYDERNLIEAEATLLRILTRSEQLGYSEGFVRALHEISRVKAQKYEPLDAEAGFRVALEYYSLRALALRRSGGMDAAYDSEVRNVGAVPLSRETGCCPSKP